MRIHFAEPPAALSIGGLDAAIRALESALQKAGCEVICNRAEEAEPDDVVHFHGLWQPAQARLSRTLSRRGVAMVVSPHGMLEPWAWHHKRWKKWPYFWLIERAHLRRAFCLLATAPSEARNIAQRISSVRLETLPLGFTGEARPDYAAARARLGWAADETVLLFLSRLHVKKGLDTLLRVLAARRWNPKLRLVVVGGGEAGYVAELKRFATEHQDALPPIDWVGEVWGVDRWPYFQGADLFCLPTHSENFGLVVLEACQVGTPVLTTTTTPWADWLKPDRGIIVEPSFESLDAGLRGFLETRKTRLVSRDELAAWCAGQFSWDTLAPKYVELYRQARDAKL